MLGVADEIGAGGNIDPADRDPSWRSTAPRSNEEAEHCAYKVCAVRETFEECGLLAGFGKGDSMSNEDREVWRKKVGSIKLRECNSF